MNFTKYIAFLSLVVLSVFISGCSLFGGAQYENPAVWRPQIPAEANSVVKGAARTIRTDDTMLITITPGALQASSFEDIVDSNGMVTLPLVGEFLIGGLTTSEAEKKIRDVYVNGGLYKNVTVTVVCRNDVQNSVVYISGAINKKGAIPYIDGMTLRMAIVTAGDRTPYASTEIRITRNGSISKHNISRIENNKEIDPVLKPNDMIEVVERWL
jgi:protein involved in polysaccharide export with SLBB domain